MYCAAVVLEYFALIDLRISRPDLPRPFKIALGVKVSSFLFSHLSLPLISPQGLIAFFALPTLLSAINIVFCLSSGYLSFALVIFFFTMGPILWYIRKAVKEWQEKRGKSPYEDLASDREAQALIKGAITSDHPYFTSHFNSDSELMLSTDHLSFVTHLPSPSTIRHSPPRSSDNDQIDLDSSSSVSAHESPRKTSSAQPTSPLSPAPGTSPVTPSSAPLSRPKKNVAEPPVMLEDDS